MNPPSDPITGLSVEPRRFRTLAWIQKAHFGRLRGFEVSKAKVRQDSHRTRQDGWITRENGGTYLVTISARTSSLVQRPQKLRGKKPKIGAWAAYLLGQGMQHLIAA